jgi:3-oxoacyl-[acyl-carrier-protein] synthase I
LSELWVTSLGATTSVGFDAATTCASIRAGITRPVPLNGIKVLDGTELEEVPVIGHTVGRLTRGFSNVGRWLQLLPVAITDLCTAKALPSPAADAVFWSRTACLIVLPAFSERFVTDYYCSPEKLWPALVPPMLDACRATFAPAATTLQATGHIGALEAVSIAREWIERGDFDRVAVLAVDSLVDIGALEWLQEDRRLKCAENPTGLSPGEACCAFLIEGARAARNRGATGPRWGSVVTAPAVQDDRDVQRRSARLAEVVQRALSEPAVGKQCGPIVADLNGEECRAHTFAGIYPRALHHTRWFDEQVLLPLVSTGDLGAATGALQVVVACRALTRGTVAGSAAMLTMSGDDGAVGAAVLLAEGRG